MLKGKKGAKLFYFELRGNYCQPDPNYTPVLSAPGAPGSVSQKHFWCCPPSVHYKDRQQPSRARWRRKDGGWWGCPITWPNQGQGEDLEGAPAKGKPWPHANKFNPMTGISLRGENRITNIQKRYTTARCIMLPATSSIEDWAVDCLQLPLGQDHCEFTLQLGFISKGASWKFAWMHE